MDVRIVTEFIESAAAAIAVGRLIQFNLARRFPALLAYLVTLAASNFVLALLPQSSALYFWIYVAVIVPMECAFSILAVRELFSLVFREYPGVLTVGRWAMYSGIVISVAASVAIAGIFWRGGAGNRDAFLFYLEVVQRSVIFSLAVIIATILIVLSQYPMNLGRDAYFSSLFFSLLFLSDAARLLIDSLAPGLYNRYVDGAGGVIVAALLSVWAVLLRPEPQAAVPRAGPSTPAEARLLEQLDSLNALLDSASRR